MNVLYMESTILKIFFFVCWYFGKEGDERFVRWTLSLLIMWAVDTEFISKMNPRFLSHLCSWNIGNWATKKMLPLLLECVFTMSTMLVATRSSHYLSSRCDILIRMVQFIFVMNFSKEWTRKTDRPFGCSFWCHMFVL